MQCAATEELNRDKWAFMQDRICASVCKMDCVRRWRANLESQRQSEISLGKEGDNVTRKLEMIGEQRQFGRYLMHPGQVRFEVLCGRD